MADSSESGSWWRTLPGVLTAVAGLITAVTGLIVAVHEIFPGSSSTATPPATVAQSDVVPAAPPTTTAAQTARAAAFRATFPAGAKATIGNAVYELRGARAAARNPGELTLELSVRMTNNGEFDANFWDRSFRLLVDGLPRAPVSGLDDLVAARSVGDATIAFVVPSKAARLTLLVGDRPEQTVKIPIALAPAK